MWKNLKWLRLTPDRPGRGGTKTGIHTFQQDPVNDVRSLTGGHVYQGAWRREFATTTYPPVQNLPAGGSQPLALHVYVYPSLTDPSATPNATALSHQIEAGPVATYVRDVTTGGIRIGPRPGTATPAVFQNISGRCFVAEGTGEGQILDDRTPAIHAQPNQNLGIGTPTQPLGAVTVETVPNLTPYGFGYIFDGFGVSAPPLHTPNPDSQIGTIDVTDTLTITKIDTNYAPITGAAPIVAVPASSATTSNTSSTLPPYASGGDTISCTQGSSIITRSGVWPAGTGKVAGLNINFNGFTFLLGATDQDPVGARFGVDGTLVVLAANQAVIIGVYDGPTVTNVPFTITGCEVQLNHTNTLTQANAGSLGYSQSTRSEMVPVLVSAKRTNGLFRNLGNISFGPTGNPAVHVVYDGAMFSGVPNLYAVASAPFVEGDAGSTVVVDGAGPGGIMLVTTISAFFDKRNVTLSTAASATVTGKAVMWGSKLVGVGDGAMGLASFDVTSTSNPWSAGDIGKTIIVGGAGVAGVALVSTITAFVNSGKVTLANANASGAPVVAAQVYWSNPLADATPGPTYAYAWYDPETGHCSNISPLYQIPEPTDIGIYSDFTNLTPIFRVDPGAISYPSGVDAVRFSHILFFRTLSTPGSSTLYPLGSLNPFTGKVHPGSGSTRGSWNPLFHGWLGLPNVYTDAPPAGTSPNYWYDFSSDSDLLLSGGFRAPQETNEKPMVLLRGGATQPAYPFAMQYWDRRLWLIPTQDPYRLLFSCDEAQCPLGQPTESFPPTNGLDIPSEDGAAVALRVVGDLLLLTTQRRAYVIAGNNESNYRLMKVSSAMAGVGYYQMDEFPTYTGAEGEPSTLFYLGRDRKVYQWTLGANVVPISQPIQDQLDAVLSGVNAGAGFTQLLEYQFSRVHCVSAWGRRLVVVAPNGVIENPSLGPSQVHFWDIDNNLWSEGFHANAAGNVQDGLAPMTTVYGLDVPANELFSVYDFDTNKVIVRSWIRDDTQATGVYMTITTFPISFDGKKTRKQIVSMNLHATAGSWTGGMFVNEATAAIAATFGPYPDPLDSIYAPVATPADPGAQDIVVMAAQFSNQAPVVGYRFGFVVQKNADSNPAKIYALDVAFADYEEPGDGEP